MKLTGAFHLLWNYPKGSTKHTSDSSNTSGFIGASAAKVVHTAWDQSRILYMYAIVWWESIDVVLSVQKIIAHITFSSTLSEPISKLLGSLLCHEQSLHILVIDAVIMLITCNTWIMLACWMMGSFWDKMMIVQPAVTSRKVSINIRLSWISITWCDVMSPIMNILGSRIAARAKAMRCFRSVENCSPSSVSYPCRKWYDTTCSDKLN